MHPLPVCFKLCHILQSLGKLQNVMTRLLSRPTKLECSVCVGGGKAHIVGIDKNSQVVPISTIIIL